MTEHDITMMFVALGLLLTVARILGEIAQWLRQPAVVGEILAGILLGPTLFGAVAPDWSAQIFPTSGNGAIALQGIMTLAIALFLLVAGMEVDLSTAWRQGTTAMKISFTGIVFPFFIGLAAGWYAPRAMGAETGIDPLIFSLFFATALAISALPVIAKTLMDLNLYRSDLGMIIISAAVVDDLTGWIVFAVVLGMMDQSHSHIGSTILLTLAFAAAMLTVGRLLFHRLLPFVQAYTHWPGGVMSFALGIALFSAAFTEWIGIHAIFGAFLAGVAIGDSSHLRERTRSTIHNFVSSIFAPIFFASIGTKLNFATNFDWPLVLTILGIACLGKLIGCGIGAWWARMSLRDGIAVAFAMNSRGAMEIVLGVLALEAGVIGPRLFVALVVMALVTSMICGPVVQLAVGRRNVRSVMDMLSSKTYIHRLQGATATEVIRELVTAACAASGLNNSSVAAAVLDREQIMSTGMGQQLAVPQARVSGLHSPLIAVGMSEAGVDFNAPDGEPAQLIFLVLTPLEDSSGQTEILAELAHVFRHREHVELALQAANYAEFIALFKNLSQGLDQPYDVIQPA